MHTENNKPLSAWAQNNPSVGHGAVQDMVQVNLLLTCIISAKGIK